MTRRLAALAALLSLLVPAVAACGDGIGTAGTLVVLGPWLDDPGARDDESDVFRQVLAEYATANDLEITYQGTRAIGQALRAKVKDGTLPDIAILPTVGELATFATEELAQPVTPVVRSALRAPPGQTIVDHRALWRGERAYAVAIKTDVKSLIISSGSTGTRWCLGLSAAASPGWPGTDWIEDLLLQAMDVPSYESMASGKMEWSRTRPAWVTFAGYLGDRRHALLTSPVEAAGELAAGRCDRMHQSSFYAPPGATMVPSGQRMEVSGDFAARFTTNPAAEDLLRHLASGTAWVAAGQGRVFPLDPDPAAYQPPRREVAQRLRDAPNRCLDASDAMPPPMASAFQKAILEFVADPDRLDHLSGLLARLDKIQLQIGGERLTVRCSA
ncbi:hypothetical protein [Actinoplanes sp. NBRC 103695]|uniref:hypothetical protein n=1 Tax=Actinoplanes sp. NBRC 103695 TaxID=3032202 RepID=UPI0024A2AA6C|nr:hypothetical protein [Actinoplanes sp. NBRC 103695]GLY93265.1 hypothetical protein Acsp02_05210 [Actinoplanes sp. NBRC 103695]